jgi:glycosyltransferase involved in cell wall biosynthesis
MPCICIVPAVDGIGGMAAFRRKFEAGLRRRHVDITHDLQSRCDAVLVIAGTRRLLPLLRLHRRGTRIVQRLDGINWVHRRRRTGARHFIRAEYGNLILSFIRARVATHILYQSEFTRRWWHDWYGTRAQPSSVVHNGVDLEEYQPGGPGERPSDRSRILVVEGNLGGGYDMGLESAVDLAAALQADHGFQVEIGVVGKAQTAQRSAVEQRARVPILWEGAVPPERIPELDRSAHVLFSADLNAACPNSVIEALACGLPVVGFDTGALNELVIGDAGRLVPYGGDPWRLEKPDVPALAAATAGLLRDQLRFREAARLHAERALGLEKMMDGYLKALLEG